MTNTIYFGDNLDILRKHISSASVDFIFCDPPFASAYEQQQENFVEQSHLEIEHTIQQSFPPHLSQLLSALEPIIDSSTRQSYFREMIQIMLELHRVLRPTGCLFFRCSTMHSHFLRIFLDAIFEPHNFLNEIIWQHHTTKNDAKSPFFNAHDTLFFYAKSAKSFVFPNSSDRVRPDQMRFYAHDDNDGRGVYRLGDLSTPHAREKLRYEWQGFTPPKNGWRYDRETMQHLHDEGHIYYPRHPNGNYDTNRRPALKRYLSEQKEQSIPDVWTDFPLVRYTDAEVKEYPSFTPFPLIERLLSTTTQQNAVCLVPYMREGTAVTVAHNLGRQWIGIDSSPGSIALTKSRLDKLSPNAYYSIFGELPDGQHLETDEDKSDIYQSLVSTGIQDRDLLDTKQVAEELNVTTVTIRRWCKQGKYPNAQQIGREWKIPRTDIEPLKLQE